MVYKLCNRTEYCVMIWSEETTRDVRLKIRVFKVHGSKGLLAVGHDDKFTATKELVCNSKE